MVSQKTILIAEDDDFLAKAYQIKLTNLGYKVVIVSNGEEVLSYLKENPPPNLIILDLIMPQKDGFETLFELKKEERFKKIPVVIVSNLSQEEDIKKAKDLGALDFLVKSSLSLSEIAQKIEGFLKKNFKVEKEEKKTLL
jgi:two-component system, OmpR family, alkaline phosphatase synthesis response regulator PhoP